MSDDILDHEHNHCKVPRLKAIRDSGFDGNIGTQFMIAGLKDKDMCVALHYAWRGVLEYCTSEEIENGYLTSFENGSVAWIAFLLSEIAFAYGIENLPFNVVKDKMVALDSRPLVLDTTTFKNAKN